jgi:hypothetical protein
MLMLLPDQQNLKYHTSFVDYSPLISISEDSPKEVDPRERKKRASNPDTILDEQKLILFEESKVDV